MNTILTRLRGAGFTQIELVPDEQPPPPPPKQGCPKCRYAGYFVYDVPRGHPDFGKVQVCACTKPKIAQRQLELVFGSADIPPEYERATFESYRNLPIHQPQYEYPGQPPILGTQPAAADAAEAFAARDTGSILLHGHQKGSGKTALAVCIQREIVQRTACSTLFITSIDLLDRIRSTYSKQSPISEDEVLSRVRSTQLLILDELGAEVRKPGDQGLWVVERLYGIVNWRHTHHLRTVYTSNLTLGELEEHLDDRTAWRIKDHCDPNIIKVEGCNFRSLSRAEREAVYL